MAKTLQTSLCWRPTLFLSCFGLITSGECAVPWNESALHKIREVEKFRMWKICGICSWILICIFLLQSIWPMTQIGGWQLLNESNFRNVKTLHDKNESNRSRKPSEVNKCTAPCVCTCAFTNSKALTVEGIILMTPAFSISIVEFVLLNLWTDNVLCWISSPIWEPVSWDDVSLT